MDNKKPIETAIELIKNGEISREAAEKIFPELRESEDERIRNVLVSIVKWLGFDSSFFVANSVTKSEVLNYLEKQKKQKSVNAAYISGIREELLGIEDNAKNIDGLTESQWVAIRAAHRLLGEYVEQEQKPAEWSEEDERIIKDAIYDLEEVGGYPYAVKGLKSLLKARIKI